MTRSSVPAGKIEFFQDFMSPKAYLAHTQLPALVERTGASVVRRTMLTLQLHELTGNRSPMTVRNKARWALADLSRFAKRYGVALEMNPHFPMKMLDALHGAYVAQADGVLEAYSDALFRAVWVDGVNVDDRQALCALLDGRSLDGEGILSRVDEPANEEALMATTREAAERGAFGAPTFFVADEMHFGQDRLDFVEAALRA